MLDITIMECFCSCLLLLSTRLYFAFGFIKKKEKGELGNGEMEISHLLLIPKNLQKNCFIQNAIGSSDKVQNITESSEM